MLTFEEFFKKKKIDLAALNQGEPALFMEFASHYDQMGEKSFDHVKKYWFNKLRKQYHLAPEIRAEPIRNENQLAEQTVFDSLSAPAESTPKQGFTPRFKAAPPKPAEPTPAAEATADKPAEQPAAKPGFTPRFKAGVTKPVEPVESAEEITDKPAEPASPKPGFTPRFKAGVTKSAEPDAPAENITDKPAAENTTATPAVEEPKKPGFTPRFKAGVTKPARQVPPTETTDTPAEQKPADETTIAPTEHIPKKPGFTPRFKAGVTKATEPAVPAENITDRPVAKVPEPVVAAKPAPSKEKADVQSLKEADVPEFDFTGKSLAPVPAKIDKLTEQADKLASDFKSKFKATHLPKHAARLKPGQASSEDSHIEPASSKQAKNQEESGKKPYKPRFNAKTLPPKPSEE